MRRVAVLLSLVVVSGCAQARTAAAPASLSAPTPSSTAAAPSLSRAPSPSVTPATAPSTVTPSTTSPLPSSSTSVVPSTRPQQTWSDRDFPALAAARNGVLYGLNVAGRDGATMTALAYGADGRVVRRRVVATGELPYYISTMAAGEDGLYAATSVIQRFTRTPDEILRIDPVSLRVVARRTLPMSSAGGLVTRSEGVYVAGPGTVLRLDPVTLRTLAQYSRPADQVIPLGEDSFVSLSTSTSGLWVAYGHLGAGTIFRLDPLTLDRLPGSWPAPDEQSVGWVMASPSGAWRNGFTSVAQLLPDGRVGPTAKLAGSVQSAIAYGNDELVTIDGALLVLVTPAGRVSLVPHHGSQCGRLLQDSTAVWLICADGPVRLPLH